MAGHGHSHGCGGCDAEHTIASEDNSSSFNLYQKIDIDRVQCLNETTDDSGKTIFKPWSERLDRTKVSVTNPAHEFHKCQYPKSFYPIMFHANMYYHTLQLPIA